jgi:hypothetical protein
MIIIPYGTDLTNLKTQIAIYFLTVLNTLFTYNNSRSFSGVLNSLFDYSSNNGSNPKVAVHNQSVQLFSVEKVTFKCSWE